MARAMHVSERTVFRYAERYYCTGEVRSFAKHNGPPETLCEHDQVLLILQHIMLNPGL